MFSNSLISTRAPEHARVNAHAHDRKVLTDRSNITTVSPSGAPPSIEEKKTPHSDAGSIKLHSARGAVREYSWNKGPTVFKTPRLGDHPIVRGPVSAGGIHAPKARKLPGYRPETTE